MPTNIANLSRIVGFNISDARPEPASSPTIIHLCLYNSTTHAEQCLNIRISEAGRQPCIETELEPFSTARVPSPLKELDELLIFARNTGHDLNKYRDALVEEIENAIRAVTLTHPLAKSIQDDDE